ncbi:hypothetical protein GCM10010433_13640 [Streptomyces pulveraceus]
MAAVGQRRHRASAFPVFDGEGGGTRAGPPGAARYGRGAGREVAECSRNARQPTKTVRYGASPWRGPLRESGGAGPAAPRGGLGAGGGAWAGAPDTRPLVGRLKIG